MPGGARLTIEETRALCAIDVDTSQTADAAAAETAGAAGREIVLRNLGGLIAIDFAGRGGTRHRAAQLAALGRALKADRTPIACSASPPAGWWRSTASGLARACVRP